MRSLLFFGLFVFFVAPSSAESTLVDFDGKKIVIEEADSGFGSEEKLLELEAIGKGAYVMVNQVGSREPIPNATKIAQTQFAKYGIKLVDKLEDSDVTIIFLVNGSISAASANDAAVATILPNSDRAITNGGAVVGAALAGGPSAAIAFLAGGLMGSGEDASITNEVIIKPQRGKNIFGASTINSTVKDGSFTNTLKVEYKREKDNNVTDDVVLRMLVDQWIKRYMPKVQTAMHAEAVSEESLPLTSNSQEASAPSAD